MLAVGPVHLVQASTCGSVAGVPAIYRNSAFPAYPFRPFRGWISQPLHICRGNPSTGLVLGLRMRAWSLRPGRREGAPGFSPATRAALRQPGREETFFLEILFND